MMRRVVGRGGGGETRTKTVRAVRTRRRAGADKHDGLAAAGEVGMETLESGVDTRVGGAEFDEPGVEAVGIDGSGVSRY